MFEEISVKTPLRPLRTFCVSALRLLAGKWDFSAKVARISQSAQSRDRFCPQIANASAMAWHSQIANRKSQVVNSKAAFTLIELLIVTVVVLAMMGILFRLTGIAGSANAREETIRKMQCLENCLSGYYAAFGMYPPVPLQGVSRNIYRRVDDEGYQSSDPSDTDSGNDAFNEYEQVEAACRAQPVAAMFPPKSRMKNMKGQEVSSHSAYESYQSAVQSALSAGVYSSEQEEIIKKWVDRTLEDISGRPGFLNSFEDTTSANELQLFRFGLMSFLLPRYRFMLDCAKGAQSGNTEAFNNAIDAFAQWTENNTLPPRMDSGVAYASWKDFCDIMGGNDEWQIDLIPSQAACARWMPNLRDCSISGPGRTFFGVYVGNSSDSGIPKVKDAASFHLYFPGGYNGSSSSRGYPLQSYTVKDGWSNDFFYYSPAPYQTYTLWSAGANGKTFPPWIDLDQFRKDHREQYDTAIGWLSDDIKYMGTGR